ncbi:MAG: diguanylate cyclase [Solirubrobacteraceae bacterium MAG38_C4-C5]|nr:diguanylate cyclase [Candidatus Siliceabacter maunaloa]
MSFRNRLSLFFLLIVLVPMVSVAVVLFRLISDNETGKADEAVAARTEVVFNLYRQARADASFFPQGEADVGPPVEEVGTDAELVAALQAGDVEQATERAEELAAGGPITRILLVDEGEVVLDVGPDDAVAPATRELQGPGGESFGRLQVSVTRAAGFARRVGRLAGTDLVVRTDDRLLASSVEGVGEAPLPVLGTVESPEGDALRVAPPFEVPGFGGERVSFSVLADIDQVSGAVTRSRLLAGGILLGFFVLAFVFALAVSRQLQQQIAGLLDAARRLGAGDFSAKVPTEGRDEFAALGEEFNKMSDQLSARLAELARERERVQTSVRRLGEAVGSNLDRDALLRLVVTTALEGVDAQAGRVTIRPIGEGPMEESARAGNLRGLEAVLREGEARVLRSGAFAEVDEGGLSALAHPLVEGDEEHRRVNGVLCVARAGQPFSDPDRELFQYLAGQAAVSIENVDLHETAAHESVTDELTGLSNYRRFYEAVELEVERSRRFGGRLGLVMLDLDDFKMVNDTRGHLQGDEVLREIARVLRESSREIDEPARYGGEELAVVLPGTDLDGAFRLAERMREQIEALEIEPVEGAGRPVRVTASFGVASLPETADDEQALVAGADAALYRAKRAGKNRTTRAIARARTQ